MALFNQWFWGNYFPGTNMHELDLDWILNEIRKMENEIDLFEKKVLEDLQTEIGKFRDEFNQKLFDFEKEMQQDIEHQFQEKITEVNNILNTFEQKIENRLSAFETEIQNELITFEKNTIEPIKIDITNLQDIQGHHTTQIQGLRANVDTNTSSIQKNIRDIVNIYSYNAYVQRTLNGHTIDIAENMKSISELDSKLDREMVKINASMVAYETTTNDKFSDLDKKIETASGDSSTAISSLTAYVNQSIGRTVEYVNDSIKISENDLHDYIDAQDKLYNASMIAYVDNHIVDTSSIESWLRTEIDGINQTVADMQDSVDDALADAQKFIQINNQEYNTLALNISPDGDDATGVITTIWNVTSSPFKTLRGALKKVYDNYKCRNVEICVSRYASNDDLTIYYLENGTQLSIFYNGEFTTASNSVSIHVTGDSQRLACTMSNISIHTYTNLDIYNTGRVLLNNFNIYLEGSRLLTANDSFLILYNSSIKVSSGWRGSTQFVWLTDDGKLTGITRFSLCNVAGVSTGRIQFSTQNLQFNTCLINQHLHFSGNFPGEFNVVTTTDATPSRSIINTTSITAFPINSAD